jgi:hypothetical protein
MGTICNISGLLKVKALETYQKAFWQSYPLESIQHSLISLNLMYLKTIKQCEKTFCSWNDYENIMAREDIRPTVHAINGRYLTHSTCY